MRVAIVHETLYRYQTPATYSIQYLRLSPRPSHRQRIVNWKLDVPGLLKPWVDAFGNDAHVLVIDKPHDEIRVRARGEVEVVEASEVDEDPGPLPPGLYLRPTRLADASGPLAEFADLFREQMQRDASTALETLMLGVRERVDYRPGITHAATPATDAFLAGAGVCQDHAHIFVACCRRLGIPSRYVSGYLGDGADGRMASHAWAEAWIEGQGWRSYDVANRIRPAGKHVRLAVGLDYLDACPVRGFRRGGAGESLDVEVRVNDTSQSLDVKPAQDHLAQQRLQQQQQ